MSHARTSILMGVAILVSEILLLSKTVKFPFLTMDFGIVHWNHLESSMVIKKFNHLESAKKIRASRGSCHMHAHQF